MHKSSGDLPLGTNLIPVWDAGWSSLTLASVACYKNMSKNQMIAADDVLQEEILSPGENLLLTVLGCLAVTRFVQLGWCC